MAVIFYRTMMGRIDKVIVKTAAKQQRLRGCGIAYRLYAQP
jgi:hypothetical protein